MNTELKALVGALLDLTKLIGVIVEKKGLDPSELALLESLALEIQPALSGVAAALKEAKALDAAGEADLAAFVVGKLSLADPKAANILTKAMQAAIADFELVKAIKA